MNPALIITVVNQVLSLVSGGRISGDAALISWVIGLLENLIEFAIAEANSEAVTIISDIIDKLRSTDAITGEDNARLDQMEDKYDVDFEAAAKAAGVRPDPAA